MKAKPSAQVGHDASSLHNKDTSKVQKPQSQRQRKRTARKHQQKAEIALERHLHSIQNPTKGHHLRCAARRWVRSQAKAQLVTAQTSKELEGFLANRTLGEASKPQFDPENLSEAAKEAWLRYLEPMAIRAKAKLDITAIFTSKATEMEAIGGSMEEEEDIEGDDQPQFRDTSDEAIEEEEDEEGGGALLGPFAFRTKPEGT